MPRAALLHLRTLAEVTDIFASENGAKRSPAPQRSEGRNMVILRKYFQARDNRKATLAQMVEGTSVSKHSLRQIVYRTHADQFEREGHRGGGRESFFWLKEAGNE